MDRSLSQNKNDDFGIISESQNCFILDQDFEIYFEFTLSTTERSDNILQQH